MFLCLVLFTLMLFSLVLFLMMHNRTIRNLIVIKLRVFIGSADIQAADIVLVREIEGVAIIHRLSLQAQCKG